MYKIRDYRFESFRTAVNMHKSNYAVLENDPKLGIKYCPHMSFEDEFFILRELDHRQIPKAREYGKDTMYKDEEMVLNQYFLVLDHLSDIDLVVYLKEKTAKNMPEHLGTVIKCFLSACDPLDYLHSRDYIHLDIKPGHLMLDPGSNTAFLIDFELTTKKAGLIHGISKDYAAPEHETLLKLLRNPPKNVPLEAIASNIGLDDRADIYSLGTLLFEVLTQKKWKDARTPPRNFNSLIPQKLEETIMAMLEEDTVNRIATVKELKQILFSLA